MKNDYTNFELIIINDGSSDSTEELINSLNDKRIRLINTEHIGNANAKNTGITYATGDYILFIDSDDLFASNILTILTNEIEQSHADLFIFQWALFQSRVGEIYRPLISRPASILLYRCASRSYKITAVSAAPTKSRPSAN
ncbi:glycosyltransferase family 2 protein [Loigolactobacillus coryniformis]|uniref:glycosyltransferase family 2 protein n=1 Tax=Loigolactobacillus coryniformis TaxID=1610 RepID=UPI00215CE4FE|nr:glycosyltransferase family A protein [Loigolactobacillus coryniformis]